MTRRNLILSGFILLKFVIQYFLIDSGYDLHRDEFLHLDQANHLAWGYMSVPPFTSWISYVIKMLGNTVFWVKFFPALFGALTIVAVWKAVEALEGRLYALILSATCVLFSALLATNTLYQPNSFEILCWTTFYLMLIKYFKTENAKWLYLTALVFSVGFLNKYNIIFPVIGFLPAILLTQTRKVFAKKEFYIAFVVGLLFILPNLVWQYRNHFPVFQHLNELANTQLVHVERLDFLKQQLLFFVGALFVILSAFYALMFYKPFGKYKVFFWSVIFTLLCFVYFRAKGYYAMGLYPIYIAFGAVFLENRLSNGRKKYLRPVLMIFPLLFFLLMFRFAFPNKSPERFANDGRTYRWEDGKNHSIPQDFADMLGWQELAIKVDHVCAELPDIDHTLILCDNYGQAGAINYYTKNRKVTAYTFSADYVNWLQLDRKITDIVLVKETRYDNDKDREKESHLFETIYIADQRINQYAREDTISIYVLKGAKEDINKMIEDMIIKSRDM